MISSFYFSIPDSVDLNFSFCIHLLLHLNYVQISDFLHILFEWAAKKLTKIKHISSDRCNAWSAIDLESVEIGSVM